MISYCHRPKNPLCFNYSPLPHKSTLTLITNSNHWCFYCLHNFAFFRMSYSLIAEGNGNPLHCSCLENPRDGGAWWAAVYGVAQSRTRLKRLSSSSSILFNTIWIIRSVAFSDWLLSVSYNHLICLWSGKDSTCYCKRHKRCGFDPCIRKIPWSSQ